MTLSAIRYPLSACFPNESPSEVLDPEGGSSIQRIADSG